ncbi:hypothetical protein HAX54_038048 [Datura stramonium]|uniref:DUF4283 domain-containing protein n=1 Tax=Datura stramonium TaxID=4076 RepID=A0ABS8SHK8_DATST|nr:hypothetical protein [Datura stramonium]
MEVERNPLSISQFPPLPSKDGAMDKNSLEASCTEVNFSHLLNSKNLNNPLTPTTNIESITMRTSQYVNGVPVIQWSESEVQRMDVIEILQYDAVGKFFNGWPELEDLRKNIPKQCGIMGACRIRVLLNKHILIRCALQEDLVNLMSKSAYYINNKEGISFLMRPLIYDSFFRVDKETSQAMAWISFSNLLPTFFVKELLFSLASTGKATST